jgi:exosortase/archaeosortase family protein
MSPAIRMLLVRGPCCALVFALLQQGWEAARGGLLESLVIHDATVLPAALLINLLTPGLHAAAIGYTLHAPGGGINVLNGCEGTEVWLLLVAAFAVAPRRPHLRLLGALLALPLVLLLNDLRLVGLFYALHADRGWYDTLHATVTPLLLTLAAAAYFHAWLAHERAGAARQG